MLYCFFNLNCPQYRVQLSLLCLLSIQYVCLISVLFILIDMFFLSLLSLYLFFFLLVFGKLLHLKQGRGIIKKRIAVMTVLFLVGVPPIILSGFLFRTSFIICTFFLIYCKKRTLPIPNGIIKRERVIDYFNFSYSASYS